MEKNKLLLKKISELNSKSVANLKVIIDTLKNTLEDIENKSATGKAIYAFKIIKANNIRIEDKIISQLEKHGSDFAKNDVIDSVNNLFISGDIYQAAKKCIKALKVIRKYSIRAEDRKALIDKFVAVYSLFIEGIESSEYEKALKQEITEDMAEKINIIIEERDFIMLHEEFDNISEYLSYIIKNLKKNNCDPCNSIGFISKSFGYIATSKNVNGNETVTELMVE